MPTLYTYCIPYDNGAAPNPYWGLCTLVICKPGIRRTAAVGDWIVGTGSRVSPLGDIGGQIVFAMKVTRKLPMAEYDDFTRNHLTQKIPDLDSGDCTRWLGDSIYDFRVTPPAQRPGIHDAGHQRSDLAGEYALLSDHYVYFGDRPEPLPEHLQHIVLQGQGHRSRANAPYLSEFLDWIANFGCAPNRILGRPQQSPILSSISRCDAGHRSPRRTCTPVATACQPVRPTERRRRC